MIIIKMYGKKWRIEIGDEIWQFDNLEECKSVLKIILDIKDKYGKVYQYENNME